ncbi:lipoate--protein ligase family protein [Sulfurimonas sp.]|nr:lipoate--protein ligase family protein [Sulfurimonas sp.]
MLDTSSREEFRLIRSGTMSARENMAIDKVLFESFSQTLIPTLRVYTWEKSFTYGVSAKISEIKDKEELLPYKSNYAKRMTGGGILFHGNDVSYSLVIPTSYMNNLSVKQSYEKICHFLLAFYKSLGLKAIYAKDDESVAKSHNEFCQLGFEDYDILINGIKMGGNAQRRTKDVIFQHGSIGINRQEDFLHVGNCLEDLNINISYNEAQEKLIKSFKETFNVVLKDSILNDEENRRLQEILQKEEL